MYIPMPIIIYYYTITLRVKFDVGKKCGRNVLMSSKMVAELLVRFYRNINDSVHNKNTT